MQADLKNRNKHSFIDKEKHNDSVSVTVTVKLACYEDVVVAAEYCKIFS